MAEKNAFGESGVAKLQTIGLKITTQTTQHPHHLQVTCPKRKSVVITMMRFR